MSPSDPPLLCSFESRRADEMNALIERHGARCLSAPSMREIPLTENDAALQTIRDLTAGSFSHIVLLTGVGTEAMLDLADSIGLRSALLTVMGRTPIIVRGPKPAAVLSRLGLRPAVRADSPNTTKELLEAIDREPGDLHGTRFVVQEYGEVNHTLAAELSQRGADVTSLTVYRWALPEDTRPLADAVRRTINGDIRCLLFTSAQQVRHVMMIAEECGSADAFREACASLIIASIGPTCSEAIRDAGLPVSCEADPPKMGPLVRTALAACDSGTHDGRG